MRAFWLILNLVFSIGIISIPILAIGWLDRDKKATGKLSKLWAEWLIWTTGINYNVIGLENLSPDNKYIFMSNHSSALDILLGVAAIPFKIVFLAKKELFRIPVFGWAMQAAGMIKIDRQNSERAKKSVDNAVNLLISSQFSTLIYPEGTRSKSRDLLPFKKGGFILAIRTNLPIVPVTIIGAHEALPKGKLTIRKSNITIIIDKPLVTQSMDIKDKDELMQECREVIRRNLQQPHCNPKENYGLYSV